MVTKARADKKTKTPRKTTKRQVGKSYVDRIVRSRTFEPWYQKPAIGCRFWRPHERGETIRGTISSSVPNFRQCSSYPLTLENGEVVEVVGNKQLHHLIKKADCIGQFIEIEYCGRQFVINGHYRKIYRLYKLNYDGTKKQSLKKEKKNG